VDELAEWVRREFALGAGPLARTPGGRGAEALVWRLAVGAEAFALKQPFAVLDEAALAREAALLDHFARGGVDVPTHRRAADGRYAAWLPRHLGGGQVRVTHWVEGAPVGAGAAQLAGPLGALLARLHRAAPPDDGLPSGWYTTMPGPGVWAGLVSSASGPGWGRRLAVRLGDLAAYADLVDRAGPAAGPYLTGHRDLHPDNVVVAPDGGLRALDWEDAGPVDPSRELAKVLAQWHVEGDVLDEEGVRATVAAYQRAGGPGRVTDERDLAMVLCTETNFLARQARAALDPEVDPEVRHHVVAQIDATLDFLPPPAVLTRLAEVARG